MSEMSENIFKKLSYLKKKENENITMTISTGLSVGTIRSTKNKVRGRGVR